MVLRSKVQVYTFRLYLANVPENDEHSQPLNFFVSRLEISFVRNVSKK